MHAKKLNSHIFSARRRTTHLWLMLNKMTIWWLVICQRFLMGWITDHFFLSLNSFLYPQLFADGWLPTWGNHYMRVIIEEVFIPAMPICSGFHESTVLCYQWYLININNLRRPSHRGDKWYILLRIKLYLWRISFIWTDSWACNWACQNDNNYIPAQVQHQLWTCPLTLVALVSS